MPQYNETQIKQFIADYAKKNDTTPDWDDTQFIWGLLNHLNEFGEGLSFQAVTDVEQFSNEVTTAAFTYIKKLGHSVVLEWDIAILYDNETDFLTTIENLYKQAAHIHSLIK